MNWFTIRIIDKHDDMIELDVSRDALELVAAFLAEGRRELGHYAEPGEVREVKLLEEGLARLL